MSDEQVERLGGAPGFIAALDQSGGSTPKALALYGLDPSAWSTEAEMFDLVHAMRARIITSPSFTGDRVLAAILFEDTMDRQVDGCDTAEYLWRVKRVVPLLKIDQGLELEGSGVQLMKPIVGLDELLERARSAGIVGTKERSVIKLADGSGIAAVAAQQFDVGRQVLRAGLVPILEPEIDVHSPEKAAAEVLLREALLRGLDDLAEGQRVMIKLTLPEVDDAYAPLVAHPRVLRVVALSGGYSRTDACVRLARNHGVIASFSRALTEGLTASQSEAEFDAALDGAIAQIYAASLT